jgi:hypothetical protein
MNYGTAEIFSIYVQASGFRLQACEPRQSAGGRSAEAVLANGNDIIGAGYRNESFGQIGG